MTKTFDEKMVLAENPDTPVHILNELAKDENFSVRAQVAWNDNVPDAALCILKDDACIYKVLENRLSDGISLPDHVKESLATSCEPFVKRAVAYDTTCTEKMLAALSYDESEHVRIAVASNQLTPPDVLMRLTDDKEELVKRKVARNPSTPIEALLKLAKDGRHTVRKVAAGNERLPQDVLEALGTDEEGHVRYCVAGNPQTPIPTLDALSKDYFYEIRVNVALNQSTPKHILERMLEDELDMVRRRAYERILKMSIQEGAVAK